MNLQETVMAGVMASLVTIAVPACDRQSDQSQNASPRPGVAALHFHVHGRSRNTAGIARVVKSGGGFGSFLRGAMRAVG